MAEYVTTQEQTVLENQNVLFTNTTACGCNSILHRPGSGLITVKGTTNQSRARFKITFGGNAAIVNGGTIAPISLAISINGEPIESSVMTVTPAAVAEYFNVNRSLYIDIPKGCCAQISVKNTTTQSILVQNASIIVERVA